MRTAVLVPWRPDDAERSRNWAWLKTQWAKHYPDWEIVEGHCLEGPWVKALAVQDALTRTTADTLVIADADIWCPDTHLAVKAVKNGAAWAIPHRKVYRLTETPSRQLIDSNLTWETLGYPKTTQPPYQGLPGGGLVVIRRDLYEQAPFDPRFVGWGGEDSAAGIAWTALAGPARRGNAPLWHLWHEPQPRLSRVAGSHESMALLNRYKTSRTMQGIHALIAEYRPCPTP